MSFQRWGVCYLLLKFINFIVWTVRESLANTFLHCFYHLVNIRKDFWKEKEVCFHQYSNLQIFLELQNIKSFLGVDSLQEESKLVAEEESKMAILSNLKQSASGYL